MVRNSGLSDATAGLSAARLASLVTAWSPGGAGGDGRTAAHTAVALAVPPPGRVG